MNIDSQRKQLLLFLFIFIFSLATLHILAIQFYFYWFFWWFDILTHFLGGFWSALAVLWFIFLSGYAKYAEIRISGKSILLSALLSVIIIGLLWEIFELAVGAQVIGNYAFDTALDIAMDIMGAFAASLFFMKKYAFSR